MIIEDLVGGTDLETIARDMRPGDLAELDALGHAPLHALSTSVGVSKWARVLRDTNTGTPLCVFGLAQSPTHESVGLPWMLGTIHIKKHQRSFLAHSRRVVAGMQDEYPNLTNMVDARNVVAMNWLRYLGFSIDTEGAIVTARGHTFHVFQREST